MFGFVRKQPVRPPGPDFSTVDSQAKAEEFYRRGELERPLLMPIEFNGDDNPLNTMFVPIGTAEVKRRIDVNVIGPLAADGKVTKYTATPEYSGKSFIPIAIKIAASDPGHFTTDVNIWGEALTRA